MKIMDREDCQAIRKTHWYAHRKLRRSMERLNNQLCAEFGIYKMIYAFNGGLRRVASHFRKAIRR